MKPEGEPALRYIITRPCLAQGHLQLLKYLQPHFPAAGQVTLRDSRGESFVATVESAAGAGRSRLTGLGELYRAHHLGVNDVLLMTPLSPGIYGVECVVKPHARPASAAAPAAPPMTEKRVVIHATPHVREVRLERVPANPQPPSRDRAQPGAAVSISRSEPGSTPAQAPQRPAESSRPAVQEGVVSRPQPLQPTPLQPQFSQPLPSQPQPPAQPSVSSSRPAPAAEAAPTPAARAAEIPRELPGVSVPRVVQPTQPSPVQSSPAPSAPAPALGPERGGPAVAVKPQALVPAPVTSVAATPVPATSAPASAVPDISGPDPATPELDEQLNELARMTGYSYEALGGGVVRLRAELGSQGYSVLLATSQAAMHTPGWEQEADYRALLTREDEYPEGTGRFTEAALASLLDHAQLAPLTPVDLRGYWNTGSFDRRSAESVAELVSAHLAQRGVFSHVLLTLAQQPARSLVQPARLAERLGSGVNTAELQSILDTLSRPPFMALTPLPGGQYYLRSDVRELLGEMGHYAEGLRRRLRPAAGDD